jgi:glycosyl transferase family 25
MIDKIYIIHFKPLNDRKKYLDTVIPSLGIDFEYVNMDFDTDNLIKDNIDNFYLFDEKILNRKLNLNELSVSVSHLNVYRKILNEHHKTCLILEDDAVLDNNFYDELNSIKDDIKNFDFIFLSTCCGLTAKTIYGKKIFKSMTTRCTTGYIVNSNCLEKILENSKKISLPIDWHLNEIKDKSNLNFGWMEPKIITQGSETIYGSNLR